jgi:hypothetical protein
MPNVNSNGKFGTSMDYSMLLKLKKHNVLTAAYRSEVAPGNPVFNRDKKTRGFDNGVVDVLFQKGLFLANKTTNQSSRVTITVSIDGQGVPDLSGLTAAQVTFFQQAGSYVARLGEYVSGVSNSPSDYQQLVVLAGGLQAYMPITFSATFSSGATPTYNVVGNVDTDIAVLTLIANGPQPAGDPTSSTITYTDGGSSSGGGGGGGSTTTAVTNASFVNDEVTFNKTLVTSSQLSYEYDGNTRLRSFHYFNLNGLNQNYVYTFETTFADFVGGEDDTVILLFDTQTQPVTNGTLIADNDDHNINNTLSKLPDQDITGNWCLAVTSHKSQKTGPFTLKITRRLV